jgi:hypothetical protein
MSAYYSQCSPLERPGKGQNVRLPPKIFAFHQPPGVESASWWLWPSSFLSGECPHQTTGDSVDAQEIFWCQERSANEGIRGPKKKRGYNAVQSAVLGEFILDRDMPATLALKGG